VDEAHANVVEKLVGILEARLEQPRTRLRSMKARLPGSRFFAAAIAVLLFAGGCSRRVPPRYIVLITIDTLRDDHVGVDRGGKPLTPALDAIAADGIRYTDAEYQFP